MMKSGLGLDCAYGSPIIDRFCDIEDDFEMSQSGILWDRYVRQSVDGRYSDHGWMEQRFKELWAKCFCSFPSNKIYS